ncbi:uncharacterized protein LOC123292094 isoform X2 [Chrysoperla carnea]|uniref:uncharacterized protein LOC123292094 isoform X2 n=1 Tax=Chrysoperla carnea TaxID=189513 RepID=UPI001D06D3C6|nr:uncharacterized protein LOC123292094 isoform X2 [Chrysoperla carnea]
MLMATDFCFVSGQEHLNQTVYDEVLAKDRSPVTLDAGALGDIPVKYVVPHLEPHQLPVIGVYIDPRVITGFRYRVKPLQDFYSCPIKEAALFQGRALKLLSIGRGFARRFTFEADPNCLNNNENYFWSDSRPEGFSFEIEAVSPGDKFTALDANHEAQGTLDVIQNEAPQIEISSVVTPEGVEKKVKVSCLCKVEWYEDNGAAKILPFTGIATYFKPKGSNSATVLRLTNVSIGRSRKGYTFLPGHQRSARRVIVKGEDINDIPTKYIITGLERYELPVCGTYVDPRVIPGFYYRVRPALSKHHLFNGRALRLISIGCGYAKRITFQPDSLLNPENYFWSDSHPDGLGFEPRALHVGMKFTIHADGQALGEATVFRADFPQREESQKIETTKAGKAIITKYIHVDVTCHVRLAISGGNASDQEYHLMRVYGLAVVRKDPRQPEAQVIRVDNVGLDSQLNLLFFHKQTELTFYPLEV